MADKKTEDAPAPIATISQRGIAEAARLPVKILEQVMVEGDLSPLDTAQRLTYYGAVCKSLGLNPLTKPFAYIRLNNKLTLYALKACTDQLRANHHLSVRVTEKNMVGDLITVTAQVQTPDGRVDEDIGVVPSKGLSGEALANAMMKAVTKAKRRTTLSLCGMGWLDESEVDSIAGARTEPVEPFKDEPEPKKVELLEPETVGRAPIGDNADEPVAVEAQVLEPETVGKPPEPAPAEQTDWAEMDAKLDAADAADAAKPAASFTQPYEKDERHPAGPNPDQPACPTCGGPMWDYREAARGGKGKYEKSNPKAPDFKCRKKDCASDRGGARWPRKDDEQPAPAKNPAADMPERMSPDEIPNSGLPF